MKNNFSIEDIINNDLCTGCGACVGESSNIVSMTWNEDGFLVPKIVGTSNNNEIKVCPFNPTPEPHVRDEDCLSSIFLPQAKKYDRKIGRYLETYVGYSNDYRETSSSGGIATYLFDRLLNDNLVQHLFIVKEQGGTYEYQFFSDGSKIKETSKTRYIPVTLEKLFAQINQVEGKVAVSGVACFIKAIRLKQHYHPELREKIPFLIGIICGGLKSRLYTDFLAQSAGIQGFYRSQEYRIKDAKSSASSYGFGAYDSDNKFHIMKMNQVGDMWGTGLFKANACDSCDDVTTELADISVGDAWIQPYRSDGRGTSIIITRTQAADDLIKRGIDQEDLVVDPLKAEKLIASQSAGFKHRQQASKYRLDQDLKKGRLVPHKRDRFYQRIPVEFQIVQNERRLIRAASIEIWKKTTDVNEFNCQIDIYRKRLKRKTKLYHIIQRIRRKLRLKTL